MTSFVFTRMSTVALLLAAGLRKATTGQSSWTQCDCVTGPRDSCVVSFWLRPVFLLGMNVLPRKELRRSLRVPPKCRVGCMKKHAAGSARFLLQRRWATGLLTDTLTESVVSPCVALTFQTMMLKKKPRDQTSTTGARAIASTVPSNFSSLYHDILWGSYMLQLISRCCIRMLCKALIQGRLGLIRLTL